MKILNINSYYYSSTVHKNLQDSILNLNADSYSYIPLDKGFIPRSECEMEQNTRVINSYCYNKHDRYIFHLKHTKILKDITRKLDIDKFTCMHAHSLFSNGYIAYKLNQKFKIPYIVAVRDTDINTFFSIPAHLKFCNNHNLF